MSRKSLVKMFVVLFVVLGALGSAVGQMPNPYGLPISLENAKKAAAPALAEAVKNNWTMAVAIVGPAGNLIYFEKMDNTQLGSAEVAIDKARTAALFKRPTRAFQDVVAAGGDGLRVLFLKGVVAVEGGIPWLKRQFIYRWDQTWGTGRKIYARRLRRWEMQAWA